MVLLYGTDLESDFERNEQFEQWIQLQSTDFYWL
mgnify:CR=1 FL=1